MIEAAARRRVKLSRLRKIIFMMFPCFVAYPATKRSGRFAGNHTMLMTRRDVNGEEPIICRSFADCWPIPAKHLSRVRDFKGGIKNNGFTDLMVPLVRLERTLLAELDFESSASTIPPQGPRAERP